MAGGQGVLTVAGAQLLRDGAAHRILSGAIHYFRVHPQLWEDRLHRLQAMGLNTIETYVAWNIHERERGVFDFTGQADLGRFIEIAGDLGLDVIVRPGPYICAEWDFGGLPAWLLSDEGIAGAAAGQMPRLRCSEPAFLDAVEPFLAEVLQRIAPLQSTKGGPVVAVQVENEYGSFGNDRDYLAWVHERTLAAGIEVLLVTSDGPTDDMLHCGSIPGVLATANFGSKPVENLAVLERFQPDAPQMCMEFWNGWFDHWGEQHHVRNPVEVAGVLDELLGQGAHVNIYMAHGGTNHGLWNGANFLHGVHEPTVTSYDYDAPVGEAGQLTDKYWRYREVLEKYANSPLPQPPPDPARLSNRTVEIVGWADLADHLDTFGEAVAAPLPLTMEALGQDHGLVLYRTELVLRDEPLELSLDGLADRALILLDGEPVGVVSRNDAEHSVSLPANQGPCVIEVLVENQGRINFGPFIGDRKGIAGARLGRRRLHEWTSRPLPLDSPGLLDGLPIDGAAPGGPGPQLARTTVEIDEPADGFIALPGWDKGFVWLNGVLLGRYWSLGPQVTLYAPAPLWQAGVNEIVVLELHEPGTSVEVRSEPDLGVEVMFGGEAP